MTIRPEWPLGKFARAQALERLAEVSRQMRSARRDPDVDAIHALRVAIRRFSSVLQVLPECFSPKRAKKARKQLKRILKAAGEVRDRDIALALATQAANGRPYASPEAFEAERRAAARRLRRLLAKDRRRRALAAAKRAVQLPKRWPAPPDGAARWRPEAPAAENAVERLPVLIWELFDAGRRALRKPIAPAKLHELRLKTKRRRYTLELFAPCYDEDLAERIGQLKGLQDLLGDINDCRASKDLAQNLDMHTYLDLQRDRLIGELGRFWIAAFDAPGECEGWMLELARRSSAEAAAPGR